MEQSFKVLLIILNAIITALNKSKFELRDAENPDYCISRIRYDKEGDVILYDSKEVPLQSDDSLYL